MQKMTKDEIKVGDEFERKSGTILTITNVGIGDFLHARGGDGEFVYKKSLFNDMLKIEPKYIENTEKVKWAMNKMKRDEIAEILGKSLSGYGGGYAEIDGQNALILIKELSAPEKFDPIEHLNNDGVIQQVGFQVIKIRFYDARFQNLSVDNEWQDIDDLHVFLTDLVMEDWEVSDYAEPEPTQEEVVKKGWAILCRLNDDDLNGEDQKSVDAAIEYFDKMMQE